MSWGKPMWNIFPFIATGPHAPPPPRIQTISKTGPVDYVSIAIIVSSKHFLLASNSLKHIRLFGFSDGCRPQGSCSSHQAIESQTGVPQGRGEKGFRSAQSLARHADVATEESIPQGRIWRASRARSQGKVARALPGLLNEILARGWWAEAPQPCHLQEDGCCNCREPCLGEKAFS